MGNELVADFLHLPLTWYISIPKWWYRFLLRLLIHLDNQAAVRVMFRFWLVPVWQDTTVIGRFLWFTFRTVRIVIGIVIILFTFFTMIFWLVIWLLAPILLAIYHPALVLTIPFLWIIDASIKIVTRQRDD